MESDCVRFGEPGYPDRPQTSFADVRKPSPTKPHQSILFPATDPSSPEPEPTPQHQGTVDFSVSPASLLEPKLHCCQSTATSPLRAHHFRGPQPRSQPRPLSSPSLNSPTLSPGLDHSNLFPRLLDSLHDFLCLHSLIYGLEYTSLFPTLPFSQAPRSCKSFFQQAFRPTAPGKSPLILSSPSFDKKPASHHLDCRQRSRLPRPR